MVRGLNVQQLEEVAMQEECHALGVVYQARELTWELMKAGKLTHKAQQTIFNALALLDLARSEASNTPVVCQEDVNDLVADNVADQWQREF